jgi:uncharacterized glyoxalase superfamily protein PhnB
MTTAMTQIIPYLAYDDAPKAIDFLCKAFGFEERFRYPMPDGRVGHAELACGDCSLMLASTSESFGFVGPQQLRAVCAQVYCRVGDIDAHYARAKEAGATIVGELAEDHGARSYRALDLEGHRWIFAKEDRP